MKNHIEATKQSIASLIEAALKACLGAGEFVGEMPGSFVVEIPADRQNGDFATNIALVSAKAFRQPPRKIAEALSAKLAEQSGDFFAKVEVAGAGFINFFMPENWFAQALEQVTRQGESYGRSDVGKGKKVMVEFVSANPTGPMHLGNARGGALGDTLAAAFDFAGYETCREFYVNDAGNQITKLGKSLEARYLQIYQGEEAVPFPEDGYQGEDIKDRAQEFSAIHGDKFVGGDGEVLRQAMVNLAVPQAVARMKSDLAAYRIHYDSWFSEQSLYDDGSVDLMTERLKTSKHVFESEGALWFRSTDFGAEKDDVLVRANGVPTYYLVDIAYHYNKIVTRGYDLAIDVWGADHHGHVARMKDALEAIEVGGDHLDVVLLQLVRLIREGEVVRMSKRTGKSITLVTLLEEVPVDAARFFFNWTAPSSHLDFDLDLAVAQDSKNPVYYVQYAHARICSLFKNLGAEGVLPRPCTPDELAALSTKEEQELIRHLALLPGEIIGVTISRDPSKLSRYVVDLATKYHKFYASCRVKGEAEPLLQARLTLSAAVRTVLQNVLGLLKVTAPDVM